MLGNYLRTIREMNNLTMDEAVEKINDEYSGIVKINKGNLSKWERDKAEPKLTTVKVIADFYGLCIDDLVEGNFLREVNYLQKITETARELEEPRQAKVLSFAEHELEEQSKVIDIHDYIEETMYGYLSAGSGEFLDTEIKETVQIPKSIIPDQHYDIVLQVNGDSMEPMFEDKEYVFVRKTEEIRSGQIAVLIINGESYLKKVYINDDHIRLVSLNKKYDDLIFDGIDDIKVVGTVVM